jgi:hypothetical protein
LKACVGRNNFEGHLKFEEAQELLDKCILLIDLVILWGFSFLMRFMIATNCMVVKKVIWF